MSRILITGARGNLGVATAKWLSVQDGVELVLAMRDPSKVSSIHPLVKFDFLDASTYEGALHQVDAVFLVRPPELATPEKELIPFLKTAKEKGVKKVVFVSLLGIEKSPWVPHYKTEQMIKALEFEYVFLRPSFFMQNLLEQHGLEIKEQSEIWIPVGDAKTSFIDTDDIGRAAAKALTDDTLKFHTFDLTGSKALTYNEVAAVLSQTLGRPIRYKRPNMLAFRTHRKQLDTPKSMINVMTMLYLMTWLGTAQKVSTDLEVLIDAPAKSFVQFAREHAQEWL